MKMLSAKIFAFVAGALAWTIAIAAPDIVVADFENGTFQGWRAEGSGFGEAPSRGDERLRPSPYSGFMGRAFVHTFRPRADAPAGASPMSTCIPNTGSLISPKFTLERPFLNFLMGGGNAPDIAARLIVDGKVVRTATGDMGPMEKQARLSWRTWDVSNLKGKRARIELSDASQKYFLMADHFVMSDTAAAHTRAERALTVDKPWLHLPVREAERLAFVRMTADGLPDREFEIALCPPDKAPDFWVYEDMRDYAGKTVKIIADIPQADALEPLALSDVLPEREGIYREARRPLYHFSAMRGRIADPVGLVWHNGRYHMFLEHWSYGNSQRAVRHWGHAVSKDLIHWEELPAAIYTDELGTIFSGSAVVDARNTGGFQTGTLAPIVCVFTSAGGWSPMNYGKPAAQSLAVSNDGGATFQKYACNPVLPNFMGGNRDPKVIWHAPTARWVMALYLQNSRYKFFTSADLKNWEPHGELHIPGIIENPDLYPIALDGDPARQKWIFSANGVYAVGNFDGQSFTVEAGPFSARDWCNTWAEQTFYNAPDGRRVQMAYLQRARWGGEAFSHQTTFPREITLRTTPEGPRLYAYPLEEIRALRAETHRFGNRPLSTVETLRGIEGEALDIDAVFALESADAAPYIEVNGEKIGYDARAGVVRCQTFAMPLKPENGTVRLRILADRASLEIFGNGGVACLSTGIAQPHKRRDVRVGIDRGKASFSAEAHRLRSIWTPPPANAP